MTSDLVYSRPLLGATRLGDDAEDVHRFLDKHVLVRSEARWASDLNVTTCLLTAARLAVRVCRNLTIQVPAGNQELDAAVARVATEAPPGSCVELCCADPDFRRFDAILSVGTCGRAELPWTVVNSDGWVARVSSLGQDLPGVTGVVNPIAAVAAASLGVADVFKRLIGLRARRGGVLPATSFSLNTYRVGDETPGPELTRSRTLNLLVGGAGAIGSGVLYLLRELEGWNGRVVIVDADKYAPENCATSLLVGPEQIGKFKAEVAAAHLSEQYDAKGLQELLAVAASRFGAEIPFPAEVVSGFDNIEARHEIQRLYPEFLADGAIGGFVAQVATYRWNSDQACLECVFQKTPGEPAESLQARATGLRMERLADPEGHVTQHDVSQAPQEKRAWLESRVGKRLCSVVQEGIASLTEAQQRAAFAPSVPFVASMSAALAVAELAKANGGGAVVDGRYQFDLLRGPATGQAFPQSCRSDCNTVTRREIIERWRKQRG